ncbi:hypothetical protein WR164_12700 [Philodulcilactobacillus myokoensis]|uniref:Uncharacterized protein n=1 Tax=Philodulcilactobacillus myokoensis TaxID=2929573 RepID=A0A9W6B1X6_9LACO|nr:hypothetical protein [Philodulcilactobacillus myokoensis]GLB47291.1 hypothetical protein WR164_12700 [Philodulcilactobacillus myokoensis]
MKLSESVQKLSDQQIKDVEKAVGMAQSQFKKQNIPNGIDMKMVKNDDLPDFLKSDNNDHEPLMFIMNHSIYGVVTYHGDKEIVVFVYRQHIRMHAFDANQHQNIMKDVNAMIKNND